MSNKQWIYVPKPEKFTKDEKEAAIYKITKYIEEIEELKSKEKQELRIYFLYVIDLRKIKSLLACF